jgi:Sigma-70, region 4
VLERLTPAERVAFVLHDLFAVPFDEIATVVGRSPVASKKLASRARNRVQGAAMVGGADLARHYGVVDAFLTATRGGDLNTLVELLAPDVVRRADRRFGCRPRSAATVLWPTRPGGSPGWLSPPMSRLWVGCRESSSHHAGDCSSSCG